MTIAKDNIPIQRSFNQQIKGSGFSTAKEIAGWMGAMQAQDYNMVKWALGIRLLNSTETEINAEIDAGNIIRTHLLRPTWHIVSSDDIYWISDLTSSRIKSAVKFRDRQLGLTDSIFTKCNRLFGKTLRDGNHLTREELIEELINAGIGVDNNRASHIFLRAELDGIICSGKQKNGKPTYAILEEWVPVKNRKYKDEALRELALRYFSSRGPATVQDFSWWSGLTLGNSRLALELARPNLISDTTENLTYWFVHPVSKPSPDDQDAYLLPAFDEFLISYRDRTATLSLIHNKKTISNNGMFYPAVLWGGQIIGTWKRLIKEDHIILTFNLSKDIRIDPDLTLSKSISRYSEFYNKPVRNPDH